MNIAILIPELGGGGAERVATIIGNYFSEKGENVYYFIGDYKVKQLRPVKGTVIQTGIKRLAGNPVKEMIKLIFAALKIRGLKKQYDIDISISFMEYFNFLNVLSRTKDRVFVRVCTILSKRDDLPETIIYSKKMINFLYNRADKVVVMTKFAENEMTEEYGIKREKISIIPNPIALDYTEDGEEEWIYGDKAVICVGRPDYIKQYHVAIRAFSKAAEKIPDAKLVIIGQGRENKKLQELVLALNLEDKVFLPGFRENVMWYLKKAKVFLMTSKVEGFPNSMIEAMAAGVPIVSIDSFGAPAEILGGKSGVTKIEYCPYGILTPNVLNAKIDALDLLQEEEILGEALTKLLSDSEMLRKYSEAAKRRAKEYEIEQIMGIWNQYFEKKI